MKTLQNLFRKCGSIMKVICTRNNAEFELVSKDGDDITLKDLNSGKERIVNRKSYERFYKEVEEEVVEEVEDVEEEETEEEVDEEASEDSEEEEVEDADEDAVEDFQPATLEADAGTVVVGGPCAAELDVVDEEVAVADHPDRLALGDLAIGDQHRAFADAADEQLLLAPGGDVTAVFAGEDLDDVAILCHLGGIGDAVEALAGADAQDLGLGGWNGEGDDDRGKVPCCPAGPRAVTNC